MRYFILDKICSNACALYYAAESFESAVKLAGYISRNARRATYVLTTEQVKDIFFPEQSMEDRNKYWKENYKDDRYGQYVYLPLPSNFKKYLK